MKKEDMPCKTIRYKDIISFTMTWNANRTVFKVFDDKENKQLKKFDDLGDANEYLETIFEERFNSLKQEK